MIPRNQISKAMLVGAMAMALSIVTAGGALAQTTIYVDDSVVGPGSGTQVDPYKTVTAGITGAEATATIINRITSDALTLFDAAVAWADNVTLPVSSRPAALVVDDSVVAAWPNTTTVDKVVYDRLVANGYIVELVAAEDVDNGTWTSPTAETKDLLILSESCSSGDLDPLIGVNVPIVNYEPASFDNWHYSTSGGDNEPDQTSITITNAAHALAGGFSAGAVTVYSQAYDVGYIGITEDGLLGAATVVATVLGNADRVTILGIDAGTTLLDASTNPQRVAGFFFWGSQGFLIRNYPPGLTVAVAGGTYQEAATLQMGGYRLEGGWNSAFTVRDPAATPSVLDGMFNKRIMEIQGISGFTLDGLTFYRGAFPGTDAGTNYYGGGMDVRGATDGTINDCIFTTNTFSGVGADRDGGAINFDDNCSSLVISNCTFANNATIIVGVTTSYHPNGEGGAIRVDDCEDLTFSNCTFTENYSHDNCAAAFLDDSERLTFSDCTFSLNVVADDRIIEIDECDEFRMLNCLFIGNVAGDDQIVQLENMHDVVAGPDDVEGTADDDYEMYTVTIDGCVFLYNTTDDELFGFNDASGGNMEPIAIVNCVFAFNSNNDNRLIELQGLNVLVANCTFYGNDLADQEVVNYRLDDPDVQALIDNAYVPPYLDDYLNRTVRIINCIFDSNTVGNGDYVITGRDQTTYHSIFTEIENNIFYGNVRQDGSPVDGVARVVGYFDGSGTGYSPNIEITLDGRLTGNGNFADDPLLVNPAGLDFHLQDISMAIDAGQALVEVTQDFENDPRPQGGGYDVGADETLPATPGAPANLTATPGDGAVMLQWQPATGAVAGYHVHQSTSSGGPYTQVGTTAAGLLSLMVTGLTNGTPYYFVVTAFNAGGDGPNSNEATATPQAGLSLRARHWSLYK